MPHPGFLVMRILQIVLAVIVLALCAAEAYWFSVDYVVPDGVALAIFTVSYLVAPLFHARQLTTMRL